MLSRETRRLSRLIDNLLAYARLTDVRGGYTFQALEVADVVEETLDHVRPRLLDLGFAVEVALPLDLPRVRAAGVVSRDELLHLVWGIARPRSRAPSTSPSLACAGRSSPTRTTRSSSARCTATATA